MTQQTAGATAPNPIRTSLNAALGALRFLATDRLGLLLLVWAIVALAVRPAFLAANAGVSGWPMDSIGAGLTPINLAHTAASIQWVSFAGLLALVVIGHVRFVAAKGTEALSGLSTRFLIVTG